MCVFKGFEGRDPQSEYEDAADVHGDRGGVQRGPPVHSQVQARSPRERRDKTADR